MGKLQNFTKPQREHSTDAHNFIKCCTSVECFLYEYGKINTQSQLVTSHCRMLLGIETNPAPL